MGAARNAVRFRAPGEYEFSSAPHLDLRTPGAFLGDSEIFLPPMPPQAPGSMDEDQFREAVRAKDPDAWAELYRRHSRQLSRQARLILPPNLDADDAVSEVWLRGYRGAKGYDPSRPLYPWLSKICLHVCLTARRKRRHVALPFGVDPAARPLLPEGSYPEARDALRIAIEALPRRPREVLSLRFLFFLSTEEIGRILGMRPNTVHQNLVRGMARLRKGHAVPEFGTWMRLMQGEEHG